MNDMSRVNEAMSQAGKALTSFIGIWACTECADPTLLGTRTLPVIHRPTTRGFLSSASPRICRAHGNVPILNSILVPMLSDKCMVWEAHHVDLEYTLQLHADGALSRYTVRDSVDRVTATANR